MSDQSLCRAVLVVHGARTGRAEARTALEACGFEVFEADRSETAVEVAAGGDVCLALVDLDGWELDPIGLCETLRSTRVALPILMIGDDPGSPLIEPALDAGANDFVPNPIDSPLARQRIESLIDAAAAASELEELRETLSLTEQLTGTGIWMWSPDRDEMRWSDGVATVLGLDPEAAGPMGLDRLRLLLVESDRAKLVETLRDALNSETQFQFEHAIESPGADPRFFRHRGVVRRSERRAGAIVVVTVQDVTIERAAAHRARFVADHDPLTGLSNRRRFLERLEQVVGAAARNDHHCALLYVDLDRFKHINDTLGHSSGDAMLREVSQRMQDCVRVSDAVCRLGAGAGGTVSRLGGDEFAVLLTKIVHETDAGDVAERMLDALQAPIELDGQQIRAGASIGIAVFPEDGPGTDALISNADAAMYEAKRGGGNRFQFYCPSINAERRDRVTLERRLRDTIENKALDVQYQPRVSLQTGKICALEALARWTDDELGRVRPKRFIPLAEETGLILPLGEWIMETACAQNLAWRQAGLAPVHVSVNVSTRQFAGPNFLNTVADVLKRTQLDPSALELEIIESVMMENDEATIRMLRDLRTIGVRIALDDFGTGYSSLSYLTEFPLDCLKLDRCFVKNVHTDEKAADLMGAVIDMAHSLGLRVVAEGVENEAQMDFLRERACDEVQGFLISGAVSHTEIANALRRDEDSAPTFGG